MSSDEDYYSDRDSLDGLENEDSEFHCTPPKGPTTKVILLFDFVLFEYGVVFDGFAVRDFCFLLCFLGVKIESLSGFWFVLYGNCV